MADTDPDDDSSISETAPESRQGDLTAEAKQHLNEARNEPEEAVDARTRLVELLSAERSSTSVERELERRAAASGALVMATRSDPARLAESVPALMRELRAELDRTVPDGSRECRGLSRVVRSQLVASVGNVLADSPGAVTEVDTLTHVTDAVSTNLDDRAVRAATRAFFAVADERPETLVPAADSLGVVVAYPDDVVQALGAGTLGRLAAEHPDSVATNADELGGLLDHDDGRVKHNAVEALATLADSRPDAVAPVADRLRERLDHEDVAIQHNAAGALGRLSEEHPAAVRPAVPDLQKLRDHDHRAVRRVATDALARLPADPSR
ncbi:MAG: hypothetical protein J07HX64_02429 [halophilic archaeon J07HX64]|jgi:Adaptin N terminal region.|nr:MAG: hypothetical protein J07HX64_02429 [halophilic archaeon J07HX64]